LMRCVASAIAAAVNGSDRGPARDTTSGSAPLTTWARLLLWSSETIGQPSDHVQTAMFMNKERSQPSSTYPMPFTACSSVESTARQPLGLLHLHAANFRSKMCMPHQ
jgi:hypothetical protein